MVVVDARALSWSGALFRGLRAEGRGAARLAAACGLAPLQLAGGDLRAAILGELMTLTVYRFDKYGRLLAAVAHDSKGDMSQWMLEAGHARPYHGGRREAWEELEP